MRQTQYQIESFLEAYEVSTSMLLLQINLNMKCNSQSKNCRIETRYEKNVSAEIFNKHESRACVKPMKDTRRTREKSDLRLSAV